jgi:sigma-E factor negative regulatory protein RseB
LEQILFTQIASPGTIADELLQPAVRGESYESYTRFDKGATPATDTAESTQEGWKVQWVPPGFSLRQHKVQRLAASDQPVEHIVYSDGLATISVFVEQLGEGGETLNGFSAMGAVNTYSTTSNKYQVTVVGEVPPLTVRQIAGSVVPAGSDSRAASPADH